MFPILLLAALHAPAPVHREVPPAIVGAWKMRWGACSSEVEFHADGSYTDSYNGALWVGRWRLDGRTLRVEEVAPGASEPLRWRAVLDPHPPRGEVCGEVRAYGRLRLFK